MKLLFNNTQSKTKQIIRLNKPIDFVCAFKKRNINMQYLKNIISVLVLLFIFAGLKGQEQALKTHELNGQRANYIFVEKDVTTGSKFAKLKSVNGNTAVQVNNPDVEAVKILTAPYTSVQEETMLDIVIRNNSGSDLNAFDYYIELYRKGNPDIPLQSYSGSPLLIGQTDTISLKYTFKYVEQVEVYAKVNIEGDVNTLNDATASVDISIQELGTFSDTAGDGVLVQGSLPMNLSKQYSVVQIIYPEAIFTSHGSISGVSFPKNFIADVADVACEVKVGSTANTQLDAGWIDEKELTAVFNGTVKSYAGEGELYIPFVNSFMYEGGNIVLSIKTNASNLSTQQNFVTTLGTSGQVSRYAASATEIDLGINAGTPGTFYPNTKFFLNTKYGSLTVNVKDNNGEAIDLAHVTLNGIVSYSAKTNHEGMVSFDGIVIGETYELRATKVNYDSYVNNSYLISTADISQDITLNKIEIPVAVMADVDIERGESSITWTSYSNALTEDPVYHNGTLESVYDAVPDSTHKWAGSLVSVNKPGTLIGAYILGFTTNIYLENPPVTLEMLDADFNVIAVSEPFRLPSHTEIFVDMPPVSYGSDFYLMVHWHRNTALTFGIAQDEDGSFQNAYAGTMRDGFKALNTALCVSPLMLSENVSSAEQGDGIKGYNIYRGLLSDMDNVQNWEMLNSSTITMQSGLASYDAFGWPDETTEDGVYTYAVKTLYANGISEYTFSNPIRVGTDTEVTVLVNTDGANAEGAEVVLSNNDSLRIHQYLAYVQEDGYATFPTVIKGTYQMEVNTGGDFSAYNEEDIILNTPQAYLNATINQLLSAPVEFDITEKTNQGELGVRWNKKQVVLDNDTYETGLGLFPGWDMAIGNKYEIGYSGYISDLDLYGHNYNGTFEEVVVEILDKDLQLLGRSNGFKIPANRFVNVEFETPVPFDSVFYAMVTAYPSVNRITNLVGLDTNGPHKGEGLAHILLGGEIKELSEALDNPDRNGVFAIRPNIEKRGRTKMMKTYNLYLDDMEVPVVSGLTKLEHKLLYIPKGPHEIGVSTSYQNGESDIVKLEFDIDNKTGVDDIWAGLKVYPNPSEGVITVENAYGAEMQVISLDGKILMKEDVNSEMFVLNLTNVGYGSYILMVKKENSVAIEKIVITK